jgi:mono/diheme cytochrome c family protein
MKPSIHFLAIAGVLFLINCGQKTPNSKINSEPSSQQTTKVDPNDWTTNKGIGPVTAITFASTVDETMAAEGENIFTAKCSACHKPNKRYIGPAMASIFERRTPEWTMNMILNPAQMVQEDPIAKNLLLEYNGTPMANQNLTQDEARAVLEYFRTLKSE